MGAVLTWQATRTQGSSRERPRLGTVFEASLAMNQEREDWADAVSCVDCGAELWPEVECAYAVGPETYLCFACAERRGGAYDSDEDRWITPPDESGIRDERRAHP
jgi:hypothetical protein